jgi:hypothetical protein
MRSLITAGLIALALAACSKPVEIDPDIPEQVVPQFHMALNEGRFADIYNSAADDLKKRESEKDFVARLQSVSARMGQISGTNRQEWKAREKSGDILVTLSYKSTYAAGEAAEEFVIRMHDNTSKIADYHVKSGSFSSP